MGNKSTKHKQIAIDPSPEIPKENTSISRQNGKVSSRFTRQEFMMICEYWFRIIMNDPNISIDNICCVMADYYEFIIAYKGIFIKHNCHESMEIMNDGATVRLTDENFKSAKLNIPIEMKQNAIYRWSATFDGNANEFGPFSMSHAEIMGVVSNKCDNIGECAWGGLSDLWAISAKQKVWKGTRINFPETSSDHRAQVGDIITMELDCLLSQLTFKIGDKLLYGPMQLPPRDAWYPAFHVQYCSRKASVTIIQE